MTLNHRALLLLVTATMAVAALTTVVVASGTPASHGSRTLVTEAELSAPGAVVSPDRLVALRLEAPTAVLEKGDTGGRSGDAVSLHFDRATRHVVRIDPADLHRLRARVTDPSGAVVLELDRAHPEGVLHARPGTYRLDVLRNEDGRGTIPVFLRPGSTTISTSCPGCDLRGFDARGLDLKGVDLRGAQLDGTGVTERCAEAYATGDAAPGCTAAPAVPVGSPQVIAAQNVVVTPGSPFVIDGDGSPVTASIGTLTIEPGGRVEVDSPATIDVQNLMVDGDGQIVVEGLDGAPGATGAAGVTDSATCAMRVGLAGGSGGAGADAPDVTLQAAQIEGVFEVVVHGGSGGAGGAGGPSGAVTRYAPRCPAITGPGGRGGAAGAGGNVAIYYGELAPGSMIIPQTAGGTPGPGGAGSPPGPPGAAGTTSQVEILQTS